MSEPLISVQLHMTIIVFMILPGYHSISVRKVAILIESNMFFAVKFMFTKKIVVFEFMHVAEWLF